MSINFDDPKQIISIVSKFSIQKSKNKQNFAKPDQQDYTISDSIYQIGKVMYFGLMLLAMIYTTILLIEQPRVLRNMNTLTFVLIIIYGYIPVWALAINFLFVVLNRATFAIWFSRVFVKFSVIIYPLLGLIAYSRDHFFNWTRSVVMFNFYFCVASFLLVAYQLYSCTLAEIQNPKYIFKPNELSNQHKTIWDQREEYFKSRR